MSNPVVSCITPTRNRSRFLGQAIRYFLRQCYPYRELIIVDDGTDPVGNLLPQDPRIRYLRLDRRMTVGAKRNIACAEATGELILHWDDDDWMAPWRISYQVAALKRKRADMCGLAKLVFYEPAANRAWQYDYPQKGKSWIAGGSFCYSRKFWISNSFPDIDEGEDTLFLWQRRRVRLHSLPDNAFYVALIHSGNTSKKQTNGMYWRPCPTHVVRNLMGRDWNFYESRSYAEHDCRE